MRRFRITLAIAVLASTAACRDAAPEASRPSPSPSTSSPPTSASVPDATTSTTARTVEPATERPRYTIDAALDLAANTVSGSVTVAFAPDRPTDRLVFRLWPNGPTPARSGGHVATGDATVDGRRVVSRLEGATMLVLDSGALAKGETVQATVPFSVTLPTASRDRLARFGDTVRLGSWFPILAWERSVGWAVQPPTSGFAEASLATPADFTVTLRTAPGLDVLATGVQAPPGTWRAEAVPDWAATIGHFTSSTEMVGDVRVTVGVDRQVRESPAKYLPAVVRAVRDLSTRYGPYPWPAYELAITPSLSGGIEYPGHVMQGPGTDNRTTTHEVAHQWFYALVGSDQGRDPWLDEGLATWAEARVLGTLDSFRAKPIPAPGAGRMGEPMTFWESRLSSYYRSVYVQPVHALSALGVSPEVIDAALADYVKASTHGVATPRHLLRALVRVAPDARAVFERFGVRVAGDL